MITIFELVQQLIPTYRQWEAKRPLEQTKDGAKQVPVLGGALSAAVAYGASFFETNKTQYLEELLKIKPPEDATVLRSILTLIDTPAKSGNGEFRKLLLIMLDYGQYTLKKLTATEFVEKINNAKFNDHFINFVLSIKTPLLEEIEAANKVKAQSVELVARDAKTAVKSSAVSLVVVPLRKENASLVEELRVKAQALSELEHKLATAERQRIALEEKLKQSAPVEKIATVEASLAKTEEALRKAESLVKSQQIEHAAKLAEAETQRNVTEKNNRTLAETTHAAIVAGLRTENKSLFTQLNQKHNDAELVVKKQQAEQAAKLAAAEKRLAEQEAAATKNIKELELALQREQQQNKELSVENANQRAKLDELDKMYHTNPDIDGAPIFTWDDDKRNHEKLADLLFVSKYRYKYFYDQAKDAIARRKQSLAEKISTHEATVHRNIGIYADQLKSDLDKYINATTIAAKAEEGAQKIFAANNAALEKNLMIKEKKKQADEYKKSYDAAVKNSQDAQKKTATELQSVVMARLGTYINAATQTVNRAAEITDRLLKKGEDEIAVVVKELREHASKREPVIDRYRFEMDEVRGDESRIDSLYKQYDIVHDELILKEKDVELKKLQPASTGMYKQDEQLRVEFASLATERLVGTNQKLADVLPVFDAADVSKVLEYKKALAVFFNETSTRLIIFDRTNDKTYDFILRYRNFARTNLKLLEALGKKIFAKSKVNPGASSSGGFFADVAGSKQNGNGKKMEPVAAASAAANPLTEARRLSQT